MPYRIYLARATEYKQHSDKQNQKENLNETF